MRKWIVRISAAGALGLASSAIMAMVSAAMIREEQIMMNLPQWKNERLTSREQNWLRERNSTEAAQYANATAVTVETFGLLRIDYFEVEHWQFHDVQWEPTVSRSISALPVAFATRIKAGWPLYALHGYSWTIDGTTRSTGLIDVGLGRRQLPVLPGWGLVLDSLLFGAVLYGGVTAFSRILRLFRIRRGRCPLCAYSLHGCRQEGCPECGWHRPESERAASEVKVSDSP